MYNPPPDFLVDPPCQKKVREYKEMFGSNVPADFVYPDCEEDGYFKLLQCAPLMGCHCVDRYTGEPTSKSSEESPLPTDCQKLMVIVSSRKTESLPTSRKLPTSQSTTQSMSAITAHSTAPGEYLEVSFIKTMPSSRLEILRMGWL